MAKKGANQSEDNQSKDYSIMTRLQALTLVKGTQNAGESFIIPAEYE